jgi:hypothetical protein
MTGTEGSNPSPSVRRASGTTFELAVFAYSGRSSKSWRRWNAAQSWREQHSALPRRSAAGSTRSERWRRSWCACELNCQDSESRSDPVLRERIASAAVTRALRFRHRRSRPRTHWGESLSSGRNQVVTHLGRAQKSLIPQVERRGRGSHAEPLQKLREALSLGKPVENAVGRLR